MSDSETVVRNGVAALGRALAPSQQAFVSELVDRSAREIDDYDEILDARLARLLQASIEENVIAILHVLEHDIDPDTLEAPPSAIAYARRLAQYDVPLAALLRNYRIGQADFLELAMSHVLATEREAPGPIMKRLVQMVSGYIDTVSEQATRAYEEERRRWVHRHGALLLQRVQQVLQLTSTDPPPDPVPGYELDHTHIGIVAWLDSSGADNASFLVPDELRVQVGSALHGNPPGLVVPRDDREVWLWFRCETADAALASSSLAQADLSSNVRLAVGSPHAGVAGFRRTHIQAQQVKVAAQQVPNGADRVATFAQIGPIAMMSHDMPTLRSWIGEVLGPLADDNERSARLRDSLCVFLENNNSYTAAAAELHLHRNSILYRVRKCQELLGTHRSFDDLDTQVALTVVRWLGKAALPATA